MWMQYLALDGIRAATARHATTLKFEGPPRRKVPPAERAEELRAWWARMHAPGFDEYWDGCVQDAILAAALHYSLNTGPLFYRLRVLLRRAARSVSRDARG
jgi:hypothetical protein